MGRYDIRLLDIYENTIYPDIECGVLHGRKKPLVNASRLHYAPTITPACAS